MYLTYNLFLQPLIVQQQIDPTKEERGQPYYSQVVRFLGVDEGEYRGTIFMDDPISTEIPSPSVKATNMSPPIIPDTAETSTPLPPADVDQSAITFPTLGRPKKRPRPRRPSRHTEYHKELFGYNPDNHAADTHADLPPQSHDIFSPLDMLRVDLMARSTLIGRTTSRRPAYANPIRQRLGGLVKSWPQYRLGFQMSHLRQVPDALFGQFLQWIAISGAYIEGETGRLTPSWINGVFEVGRWLKDDHISEYIAMLSHRQLVCREMVP
ncbi:hypothetical protein OWV82_024418 [Melia azedarach]|uniref:Uncharacterized protein n=1 Tax=Melia azedarach TaxID=155640 RepID=A0ACC1WQ80_MELAZ|nr:hypothetical protein OWV82_024418 [Melia azedarach]